MADAVDNDAGNHTCGNCLKTSTHLKRCSKCLTERYCDRDCQRAHWKTHKKVCAPPANPAAGSGGSTSFNSTSASSNPDKPPPFPDRPHASPGNVLDIPVPNPFTRLGNGTWLHGRSERDTYKLLIDAYRMRAMDEYKFEGKVDPESVLSGEVSNSIGGLRKFLLKIENEHRHLLPKWWSYEKSRKCGKRGLDNDTWENLRIAPEKVDIISHYEDPKMPMQLRMFAASVCGELEGQNSVVMREILKKAEEGLLPYTSQVDISQATPIFHT